MAQATQRKTPVRNDPSSAPVEAASGPGFNEVKEFVRSLGIAEKNHLLYPVSGKVVQGSLSTCLKWVLKYHQQAGTPLCLQVTQFELLHEGNAVYHDDSPARSLAYRLYKDSIRQVCFLEGLTLDELSGFLCCFKEARRSGDTEEDFSTFFWEKDCAHIQIEIAAIATGEEEAVKVPVPRSLPAGFDLGRVHLDSAIEQRLDEIVANRRSSESEGTSQFEITAEESQRIKLLTSEEKVYFPLYDFVDILLEIIVQERDPRGLQWAVKLIRTCIFALIEDLDFEHAHGLLERILRGRQQGLTDAHRLQIQEMVKSLGDKGTIDVISTFLTESPALPAGHDVFRLMKLFHQDAVPRLCELLTLPAHIPAVADVLVHLGSGYGELFSRYLLDPDPQLVKAMIQIILKTDKANAAERLAPALNHSDEAIRLLAARCMSEQQDAKAGPYFCRLLSGDSRPLLLASIQFFASTPFPGAHEPLRALIDSNAFHSLDDVRQDQCLKAMILSDADMSAEFLRSQVLRWRFSAGKASRRRKAAALKALALLLPDRAPPILRRFAAMKRGTLGHTARRLLAALERAAERRQPVEVQGG